MLLIYTPQVTNRLKYTLDFIFNRHFGIPYEITPSEDVHPAGKLCINYSDSRREGFYNIYRHPLLLEPTVQKQAIFVSRETPFDLSDESESSFHVFFQTTDHFDLKYDIFSCIFYLLSRYEEYLPHEKDLHGRYKPSNSILSHTAFNFVPVVDVWLNDLSKRLQNIAPSLKVKEYAFEYVPTFDIDNAYCYLGRNWTKKPPNFFNERCRNVLRKREKDPFDVYDFILNETSKLMDPGIFFFLLSDNSENDSNVSPASHHLHKLIKRIAASVPVGIHPSYCALEEKRVGDEKKMLEKIAGPVQASRQHFLRISFPEYYRYLAQSGISIDYSLGYPDVPGYRAGYSRMFPFFDLLNDTETQLLLQSSAWMDATFQYYQTKKIEEIRQDFLDFLEQIKKINAKLVTIFHNDLVATEEYRGIFLFVNQHVNSGA